MEGAFNIWVPRFDVERCNGQQRFCLGPIRFQASYPSQT